MFKKTLLIGLMCVYVAWGLTTVSFGQGLGAQDVQTTDTEFRVFLPLVASSVETVAGPQFMPAFDDIAPDLGVDLIGVAYGPNPVDYNQDGLLDLMFTNHLDPLSLFQQQPSGDFSDAAFASGIVVGEYLDFGDKHGAAWGDCDNDGHLDLYITMGTQQPNRLYRNLGNDTFADIAGQVSVADDGRGRAASWIDYDNDGDLDLFMTNARDRTDKLFRNEGDCTFADVSVQTGDLTSRIHKFGMAWADYDNDGDMDVFAMSGAVLMGNELDANSHLYRNNDDGTFTNVTTGTGILEQSINGAAWGDYDNDGDLDLFVTRGYSPEASPPPILTNLLYRNNGDGTFAQVAEMAGVAQNLKSQHAMWADFDNDGDLDLYVTNAGTLDEGNQPNFLFDNQGDGTFQEVAASVGATGVVDTGMSGGSAVGDVDADGFPDIIITHGLSIFAQVDGPHEVLRNQGNDAHWLQVKLTGRQSNRLGIGARVELTTAEGLFQMREMNGGVHNYGQDEMLLSFGLGQSQRVSMLTIYWPSGIIQQLTNVNVNQRLMVEEPGPSELADLSISKSSQPNPFVPNQLITYTLVVTNAGPNSLTAITLTDNLPAAILDPVYTPSSGSFNAASGAWSGLSFGVAGNITLTIVGTVAPNFTGQLQNMAIVAPTGVIDPNPNNNTGTDTNVLEIIIDNLDPAFMTSGFWNTYTGPKYPSYNDNFRYTGSGIGNRQATFTPNIIQFGDYEAFIWYFITPEAGTDVPYTVNFNGGSTTIRLNHQGAIGGGYWQSLGVYNFASGTSGNIIISNDVDGFAQADAVRLVRQ